MESRSESESSRDAILGDHVENSLQKYEKVLSCSPLSTETYILKSDRDSVCDEVRPWVLLKNRMADFDEFDEYPSDLDCQKQEGLFDISEPKFYSSSSDEDTENEGEPYCPLFEFSPVPMSNNGIAKLDLLQHQDFNASGDSCHTDKKFGNFGGLNVTNNVANKMGSNSATTLSSNKTQRSRKSLMPKMRSALGGFSFFKK